MILLLTQFLCWKILSLIFLICAIGCIPLCFVVWFFYLRSEEYWGYEEVGLWHRKICDQEKIDANKSSSYRWSICVAIIGAILSINAVGTFWPENISPNFFESPTGAAYWKLTQSFNNFVDQTEKQDIARRPAIRTNVGTEIHRVQLLGWHPPKHFYVNIRDLTNNVVYPSLYVSKHCNISGLSVNDEYNLTAVRYTLSNRPGETFIEWQGLYGAFCG